MHVCCRIAILGSTKQTSKWFFSQNIILFSCNGI
jgi:hypothetical protein